MKGAATVVVEILDPLPTAKPDYPQQYSPDFLRAMADAMIVSGFKYGDLYVAYPDKVDALASMQARVTRYLDTGDKRYLIDAANFLMIEFLAPRLPGAFYDLDAVNESIGRVWRNAAEATEHANTEADEWRRDPSSAPAVVKRQQREGD